MRVYEKAMPQPWSFDSSSTFMERMLAQIVGFRIEIEQIEGKWKLNQNHPVERRRRVVRALAAARRRKRPGRRRLDAGDAARGGLNLCRP